LSLVFALGGVALASEARGQAWVGPENSLTTSFGYTLGISKDILESNGRRLNNLPVTYHAFTIGVDYVTPLPGLQLEASLPFIGIDWKPPTTGGGPAPLFLAHGRWDDGSFHGTLTDLRLGLRYMLLEDPLAATVNVGFSFPTHDYPIEGFAAPARHLRALYVGGALGKTFDPFLPRLFAQVTYEFAYVQRLSIDQNTLNQWDGNPTLSPAQLADANKVFHTYNNNHTDITARIGYYIFEPFEIDVDLDMRIANGGFNFVDFAKVPNYVQAFHDAVIAETVILVGGGIGYEVVDGLIINAFGRAFITGTNTRNSNLFGGGITWNVL
jgi:hypothetical protein